MMSFDNSVFHGGKYRIDGVSYKGCSFNNCTIEYGGEGPLSLDNCTFNNCTWTLVGAAKNTIQFLTTMQHQFGDFGTTMVKVIFEGVMNPAAKINSVNLPDVDMLDGK
jgi:hypothetical protein